MFFVVIIKWTMNTVESLKAHDPARTKFEERVEIKRLGPDRPAITSSSPRKFTAFWYTKHDWMTCCSVTNRVYCFPWLLFGGDKKQETWTDTGVNDWNICQRRYLGALSPKIDTQRNCPTKTNCHQPPLPLPFIGHLRDLSRRKFQMHLHFDDYVKTYGKCFGFYFLGVPALCVSDPDMLKTILIKEFDNFHDRNVVKGLPEPLESGLNVVNGDRWKFLRGTLAPSFSSGKMRLMSGMMNEIADTLIGKCRVAAQKENPVDIAKFIQGLTMEVILSVAFGVKAHSQTDPDDQLTATARQSMRNPPWLSFVSLIPGADKVIKYLPYGFKHIANPLLNVAYAIIDQRRKSSSYERKDLLQSMLDAQGQPDSSGRVLTDDEVVAQCYIFLLAGYETSNSTMALTCYFLATNQDIQEKVFQEIQQHMKKGVEYPDYDLVQNLEYMDMVISETLRLYPPGYFLLRTCKYDCEINGVPCKKGFAIVAPAYSIHRDPKIWPDPEKFIPERFSAAEKAKRSPFTYMPFGHGPRHCIGMRLAQMEMKIMLARLLQQFKLETCDETEIPPNVVPRMTLSVNGPIMLNISPRKV